MYRSQRAFSAALLLALLLGSSFLSACGSRPVKGESPLVGIQGMSLEGDELEVSLHVRNVNEVKIEVRALRVEIDLEGAELVRFDGPYDASLISSGSDTLTLRLAPGVTGQDQLQRLSEREVQSLAYTIRGAITSAEQGALEISAEGRLYRVPGRPGQFR